jgi:hypothetical protein
MVLDEAKWNFLLHLPPPGSREFHEKVERHVEEKRVDVNAGAKLPLFPHYLVER